MAKLLTGLTLQVSKSALELFVSGELSVLDKLHDTEDHGMYWAWT